MIPLSIADAHTDYLMNLRLGRCALTAGMDEQMHVSLASLRNGNVKLQVFAAFVGDPTCGNATVQGIELIHWYFKMLETWGGKHIVSVTDNQSLCSIEQSDVMGALLSIEGGEACAGSLDVLDVFRRVGVRMMTLVWNCENQIGYPACDFAASDNKLKTFGRSCLEYMCQNNMAVDVSHLNIGGFWDVYERSNKPIIASHSNAHALCPHPRNLNDDQIRAIIESNGFIGMNFFTGFLTCNDACGVNDIVAHARHILSLGGEDVLGFGSDFDGIQSTPECVLGAQSFPDILSAFEKAGMGGELLEKIAYKNFRRYISGILPDA